MSKRVVITGIGIVSPVGAGKDDFWKATLAGTCGVKRITSFDVTNYRSQVGAEAPNFDLHDYFPDQKTNRLDRFAQFSLAATKMAIEDSGLNLTSKDPYQVGVCMGSGMGGMVMGEPQITSLIHTGLPRKVTPNFIPMITLNAASGQIAINFNVKGPNITISTACSSSAHAIGHAVDLIRMEKAEVMIAGGAEACITPVVFAGFCSLRTLSTHFNDRPEKALRPFDRQRDGFVMGEGAGALIIESLEHALKRKVQIYAEIAGYASTSEASHMVIPEESGKEMVKTMELALADAKLPLEDVDYINAHATSTPIGDPVEINAIKLLFRHHAHKIVINATKAVVGHTIGAAGAIAAIVCALSIKTGLIHPNINYEDPDPSCAMDLILQKVVEKKIKAALLNSFGFGSNNATLAFRRYE